MNKIIKNIIVSSSMLLSFATVAAPAVPANALFEAAKSEACKGANLSENNGNCKSGEASNDLSKTLQNVINILTVIVGIAAVILIIINGLRFILANGDSGNITSARNGIIYALVGVIVAAFAQVIVRFVIARL